MRKVDHPVQGRGGIVLRSNLPLFGKFDQLGQNFGVKSGVVFSRARKDLRVEPIVAHVPGPADDENSGNGGSPRLGVQVTRSGDQSEVPNDFFAADLVQRHRQMGGPGKGQIAPFERLQPMGPQVMNRLCQGVVDPWVHRPVHHTNGHLNRLRRRNRGAGHDRLHAYLRMFVFDAPAEPFQRLVQTVVPAAHHPRRIGASPGVFGIEQLAEQFRLDPFDRGVGRERLVEMMFIARVSGIERLDPGRQLPRHLIRVARGHLPLRLITRPSVPRLERVHDTLKRRPGESWPAGDRRSGRDAPDAAMRLVTRRIAIGIILMTGDRVIPVYDVERSVRTDLHVDGPKVAVAGLQQRLLPLQRITGAVGLDRKPFDAVGLVVPDRKIAMHRFGQ